MGDELNLEDQIAYCVFNHYMDRNKQEKLAKLLKRLSARIKDEAQYGG